MECSLRMRGWSCALQRRLPEWDRFPHVCNSDSFVSCVLVSNYLVLPVGIKNLLA